ncbi:hypothetical protein CDL15_Pgr013981 [Punica granatum]|uniref:Uncharacterized protein n=1 Tax=Punica granatum TaxID=22663 RepID=A0A218WB03_PUNGR|nr:hypothetical protein CDL15_Pgr013981 [Punica granatum]
MPLTSSLHLEENGNGGWGGLAECGESSVRKEGVDLKFHSRKMQSSNRSEGKGNSAAGKMDERVRVLPGSGQCRSPRVGPLLSGPREESGLGLMGPFGLKLGPTIRSLRVHIYRLFSSLEDHFTILKLPSYPNYYPKAMFGEPD